MKYKSITEIVKRLSEEIERLENGEMNVEELEGVLDDVRSLHERIAILQYLAIQPDPKKQAKPSSFSFGVDQNMLDSLRGPSNQTNLLDAIEQEGRPEDIVKNVIVKPVNEEKPVEEKPVEEKSAKAPEPEPEQPKTLAEQQKEEQKSINDTFSSQQESKSLADKLSKKPIGDLSEAIGLNQKFLFMNDLFAGENNLYKEAVNTLNNFSNFIEADEYINVLTSKHNWDKSSRSVKDFIELVERRYS